MKKNINGLILILFLSLALIGGEAEAASSPRPWPTHAPEATPYVRVYDPDNVLPAPEIEPERFDSLEAMWGSIYDEFGRFYAKSDELEMFRGLPQDEPYSFVPHSAGFVLDEGEAMRMARLFAEKDGCEVKVIAMHQLIDGVTDWSYLTVVTVTPARMFALSTEMDEPFMIEQLYDQVRERFNLDYWPDGLYAGAEEMLNERYTRLGCLYFEPAFWDAFQSMPQDEAADFALVEFTPSGWSQDGQNIIWQLQGKENLTLTLRWRSNSAESLAVVTASPERLMKLSEELYGHYLIAPLSEEQIAVFDNVLNMEDEVIPG